MVSTITLSSCLVVLTASVICYSYNIMLDIPFGFFIEFCTSGIRVPRPLTKWNFFANRIGGMFNVGSVLVDILMVRFIKRTILPSADPIPATAMDRNEPSHQAASTLMGELGYKNPEELVLGSHIKL